MTDVFISYARLDGKSVASRLEKLIEDELGLETFYDATDLRLGVQWMPEIEEAIQKCTVMIVVVSEAAYRSPYVPYEWGFALGLGKQLIPLIIHPEVLKGKEPSFFQKLFTFLRNGQAVQKPAIHEKLLTHQYWLFTDTEEKWPALKIRLKEIFEFEKIPEAVKTAENDMLNNSSESIREGAIKTLENNHQPSAIAALKKGIKSSHPDVHMRASLAFARRTQKEWGIPHTDSIAGLKMCMKSGLSAYIGESVRLLIDMNSLESINAIIDTYFERNDSLIMNNFESQLGKITNFETIPALKRLWDDSKRTAIMLTLARLKAPDFLDIIIETVKPSESDGYNYAYAMQALGFYGDNSKSIEAIKRKMIAVMNDNVRYSGDLDTLFAGIKALQEIGTKEVLEFFVLIQNTNNFRTHIRNIDTIVHTLREKVKQ